MVDFDCPWCGEDQPLELQTLQQSEAPFACADCGTSIDVVDAPVLALDIAA